MPFAVACMCDCETEYKMLCLAGGIKTTSSFLMEIALDI